MSDGKCPHADVQDCPLYVAGHEVGLPTCMKKWDSDGCDVEHGLASYAATIAELRQANPRLVAIIEWQAAERAAKAQSDRNKRLNGVH